MNEIKQGQYKGKFKKLVPSQMLKSPKTFMEIEGNDKIFMIQIDINSVYQIMEKGGQPVINPKNSQPIYELDTGFRFTPITREDYDTLQNSRFSD